MLRTTLDALPRRRIFVIIILGMILLALGAGARSRLKKRSANIAARQQIPGKNKERVEGEVIALRPTGFEPAQINRPAGPFLLLVNNYSKLKETVLVLDKNDGSVMRTVSLLPEHRYWSETIDLPPGSYTLREVAHNWVCHLVIH